MDAPKIRSFIAIDLPEEITESFYKTAAALKKEIKNLQLVPCQNIHLTLKYLGYLPESSIKKIKNAVDKTAADYGKFNMTFREIGVFPSFSCPRVIWISPGEGEKETEKLKEKLDKELSLLEIEKDEKEFKAHITIARLKEIKKRPYFEKIITGINVQTAKNIQINSLHLYQSVLTRTGPVYTKLHSALFSD
ncbi:MAG: RNA 2',3'-cyclic phosphodiesterase [Candidatus Omnitrophota bacterium]